MEISTHGAHRAVAATDFSFNGTSSGGSVDSFAQQLLTAIEGYLNKSGNGSKLEVDIQGTPGQNSGGNSQFVVTLKNLDGKTTATTPAAATDSAGLSAASSPIVTALKARTSLPNIPESSPRPSVATVAPVATPAAASHATPAATPALDKSKMTPDQAYWASQPPAVQALQYTPDDQRGALAEELASQGYQIDVPIMVWNWDPLATMVQRQIDGYTWVPSLKQAPVNVAPGVSFPGSPSYDPSNPPAGSIKVTTAFAAGTNGQNSWIKNFDTTTAT